MSRITEKMQDVLNYIDDEADELGWADISSFSRKTLQGLLARKLIESDMLYSKARSTSIVPKKVYVFYEEECNGGDICAGEENDAYPSHEDTHWSQTFLGVASQVNDSLRGMQREICEVPFSPKPGMLVNVVVVNYNSGDTFGSSLGHIEIVGVYDSQLKAEEVALSIKEGKYKGYCAWDGYFESLNHVEVRSFCLDNLTVVSRY